MQHIVQFIACHHEKGYAPSTLASYCSGIGFMHKINGLADPTDDFVIRKILEGCRRLNKTTDSRLPICKHILEQLCNALPYLCSNIYETKLFTAAFKLAYYGMLRVSEFAHTSVILADRPLQLSDVALSPTEVLITIRQSKTSQSGKSICLQIPKSEPYSQSCHAAVQQFLEQRPTSSTKEQFFCHNDHSKLTRYQFAAVLSKCIRYLGLSDTNYKTHSFRIGRATDLSLAGVNSEDMKSAGRWSSNTYNKYIRT